jgi:hypothetical protein
MESGSGESQLRRESVEKRRGEKLRSSSDGGPWKRRKRLSKDPEGGMGRLGVPTAYVSSSTTTAFLPVTVVWGVPKPTTFAANSPWASLAAGFLPGSA